MEGRTYANNEKLTFSPFAVPCMLHCTWPPFHGGATAPYGQGHRHPEGIPLHAVNGSTRYPARSVRLRLGGQGIQKAQPTRWRVVRCFEGVIPPQACAPLWKRLKTAKGGGVGVAPLNRCAACAPARG